ncbi:TPA: hypothetical protein ACUK79_005226, partial [Escherichia coli]
WLSYNPNPPTLADLQISHMIDGPESQMSQRGDISSSSIISCAGSHLQNCERLPFQYSLVIYIGKLYL